MSVGTQIIEARAWAGASGSVTTIAIARSAPTAPLVYHLCASITHSSPSRTARPRSRVGSEPDTSGSVIEKQERMRPSSSGSSQRSRCSAVPCSARISMLPVSGAEQLKAIGAAIGLRPISSQSSPYSQFFRPGPKRSSGMKRFQRPASRACSRTAVRLAG